MKSLFLRFLLCMMTFCTAAPLHSKDKEYEPGRLVMFIGVDISGSFMNSRDFDDSLRFLSNYLYAHLNGVGDMERPHSIFVGSIGGARPGEMKTFYPIQAFQDKNIDQIEKQLHDYFPKKVKNPFTDYNAYFTQVAHYMQTKKLVMRPVSIILLSDGLPDLPGNEGKHNYRNLNLKPLENLTRNLTVRLLYTNAVVAANWQTKVPRQRVKVWTQDAAVMRMWNASNIFHQGQKFEEQNKFFSWIRDNVDFNVRVQRVD